VSITRESAAVFQPDVIVVGGGLIGLTCATAVARHGLRVLVISSNEQGAASPASAGILAPSVGHASGPARALGIAARDMYSAYLEGLASRTGVHAPLDRSGVLEVAFTDEEAAALRSIVDDNAEWIDARALHDFEPALAPAAGAVLHREDGAVDSGALLHAVRVDAERDPRISLRDGRVTRLETGRTPIRVDLVSGDRVGAPAVVVAAGAWVSLIAGLPRPLPVVPVRGQLLALAGAPVRHVVMSPRGYLVPRRNRSLVGSTMEHVGFDARTTEDGAALLRGYAREISPELATHPIVEHWAGLRPVTPDLLPVVGGDPECKGLFYACGHSRNGVLLAPLTADLIADLISGGSPSVDISAYAPDRFGG
jgi:glycine oxidase